MVEFDALQSWRQEFGGIALFYEKLFSDLPGTQRVIHSRLHPLGVASPIVQVGCNPNHFGIILLVFSNNRNQL